MSALLPPRWLPLLAVLSLGFAGDARAFCRSTTCKGAECARDADGCPSEGLPLFWPGACVGFSFQRDLTTKLPHDEVKAALRRSFFAWTQLGCKGGPSTLSFSEGPDVYCYASVYDDKGPNVNVVLLRDYDFPYRDEDNTLAKTTVTYDAKTGAILDADIEINAAFNELTVADPGKGRVVYDLESIMTHEVGHFIGIAHTSVPEATMFASYETGKIGLRSLDADDIEAACAIYPPTRQAACDPTPRGGLKLCEPPAAAEEKGGCSLGPRSSWAWVVLGVALVASLSRRLSSPSRRRP